MQRTIELLRGVFLGRGGRHRGRASGGLSINRAVPVLATVRPPPAVGRSVFRDFVTVTVN